MHLVVDPSPVIVVVVFVVFLLIFEFALLFFCRFLFAVFVIPVLVGLVGGGCF